MKIKNGILEKLKNIKMVLTDYDGTLTHRWELSIDGLEAVRRLERNGIIVSFVSSNNLATMAFLAMYYGISGYVISESGAVISKDLRIVWAVDRSNFPRKKIEEIMISLGFESILNDVKYVDLTFFRTEKSRNVTTEEIIRKLKNEVGDVEVYDSGYAVHILPKGVSKSNAFFKLLGIMNLKNEEVVVIGDGANDLDLFEVAEISAAPSNAADVLKERAKILLDYPNGKGFAQLADLILKVKKM